MLRLITHIERLLLVQDCVLVPGLGGFVLQIVNAAYNTEENVFVPMQKEIVFNATLQHNDGLLCESYMQMYGLEYRDAQHMMECDIEELKSTLYANGEISLGFIGDFRVGVEGQIVFIPRQYGARSSVYSYGLSSFSLPKLAALESSLRPTPLYKEEHSHEDVFYIPVRRSLIRTVVASVAAILLFLLVSKPIEEVNPAAYKASFVPTEIVYASPEPKPEAPKKTATVEKAEPSGMVKNSMSESPKPVEKASTKPAVVPKSGQKMYHIIIASFPNQEQADEYLQGVDKSVYAHAAVIERSGRFRVYADRFDNRAEAESYLESVRGNEQYKDAWLFISR